MTIIPNFNPGSVATAFGSGEQKNANLQSTNIANTVNTDTNNRANARAPLLLQQDKNKLLQQKTAQVIQNMSIAASKNATEKAVLMTKLQLGQSLAPNKQMAYYQSLQPDIHKVFKGAVDPSVNFFGSSAPLHQQLSTLYTMLAGPNTSKIISDAQGRQFRTNRLTGNLEQVQVNQNQTQPVTVPQPTGIQIPALNGSSVPAQTFGASLGQGHNQAQSTGSQTTNTLISPKLAKNQSDAANKAEQLKLNQDKNSRETVTANRKTQQAKAAKKAALALDVSNYSALDSKYNTNLSSIDNLFKSTNGLDSSVGAIKGKASILTSLGDKAANFQTDLNTFIANLSINTLTQSKRDGATWGALSEKELALLTAAAANLSLNQTPASFRKNLAILRKSMSAYQRRYRFAYKKKYGKLPSRQEQGLKPLNDNNISKSDAVAMTNAAGDKIMERPNGTRYLIKAGK